ncbi:MAG: maltose ABC transporter substrate-binding protein, partial [Arthrobacter sp.]
MTVRTDGSGAITRRSFTLGAFGTSAALMLAACGGGSATPSTSSAAAGSASSAAPSTSTTLTLWVDAERAPALKSIAAKFKEDKGIEVKL